MKSVWYESRADSDIERLLSEKVKQELAYLVMVVCKVFPSCQE